VGDHALEGEGSSKGSNGEADTVTGVGGVDHELHVWRDAEAIIQLEAEEDLSDVLDAVCGSAQTIDLATTKADGLTVDRAEEVAGT